LRHDVYAGALSHCTFAISPSCFRFSLCNAASFAVVHTSDHPCALLFFSLFLYLCVGTLH
jgi:hypothetical protein